MRDFIPEDLDVIAPQGIWATKEAIDNLPPGTYLALLDGHLESVGDSAGAGRPGPVIGPLNDFQTIPLDPQVSDRIEIRLAETRDWLKYQQAARDLGEQGGVLLGVYLTNFGFHLRIEDRAVRFGRHFYRELRLIVKALGTK